MIKMFLGLLAISVFLVGCTSGSTLECKQLGNIVPSHKECVSQGFDTCAGATLIWTVRHGGITDLVTFPLSCDDPYDEVFYMAGLRERLDLDESARFIGDDTLVTCCSLK